MKVASDCLTRTRRPFAFFLLGILQWSSLCVAWLPPPHVCPVLQQQHSTSATALFDHKSHNNVKYSSHNNNDNNDNSHLGELVRSVNYFISRKCNYACQFCFHTQKTSTHLSLEQAKQGLRLLAQAGTQKMNFAGGEPFLHPTLLGELCRYASRDLNMAVSIISNGSLITQEWMQEYGAYVDVMGVSVDSFDDATNAAIGRGTPAGQQSQNQHVDRIYKVRDWCRQHDIMFKVNTVVCRLNWQQDMTRQILQLDPKRWKIFQVLLLEDENMGRPDQLRDARSLVVSDDEFAAFVARHAPHISPDVMKPESNAQMQNSYLLLDEEMRFLDCSKGGKVPGESILHVGVEQALSQAGFDHDMFQQRGGVYDWKRERTSQGANVMN